MLLTEPFTVEEFKQENNIPHIYENTSSLATEKINKILTRSYQWPIHHYKTVNGDAYKRITHALAWQNADTISTCTFVMVDGYSTLHSCTGISFDIDLDKSDASLLSPDKTGKLCVNKTLVRKRIIKNFPELADHVTNLTKSRNTGLSMFLSIVPFEMARLDVRKMATDIQHQIGDMLLSIGIGVDKGAYGLIRDIPNYLNPRLRGYRNAKKRFKRKAIVRLDGQGNPIRHPLSEMLKITKQYKSVWYETKSSHPEKYLAKHYDSELKLAHLYKSGHKSEEFKTQKEAAAFLDITLPTFRKWLRSSKLRPQCLTIEHSLVGYLITVCLSEVQVKRVDALLKGNMAKWILPLPEYVYDGMRNEYIWRCAATLKMSGYLLSEAIEIIGLLVMRIPEYQSSRNCRRFAEITDSIYRTREYVPGQYINLKQIPGLDDAINGVERGCRNPLLGILKDNCGIVEEEASNPKILKSVEIDQVKPSLFSVNVKYEYGKVRQTENVLDKEQKAIHRCAMETIVKPLIDPILNSNSFNVSGKGKYQWKSRKEQLGHVFNHSVKIDIKNCFPSVNHEILKSKMTDTLGIEIADRIFAAVTADRIIYGQIETRTRGIPLGSTFSNVLINLYFTEFDNWLEAKGFKFTRFVDDINVYGNNLDCLVKLVKDSEVFLKDRLKLELNHSKTRFL